MSDAFEARLKRLAPGPGPGVATVAHAAGYRLAWRRAHWRYGPALTLAVLAAAVGWGAGPTPVVRPVPAPAVVEPPALLLPTGVPPAFAAQIEQLERLSNEGLAGLGPAAGGEPVTSADPAMPNLEDF